jgi:hypothetical protein
MMPSTSRTMMIRGIVAALLMATILAPFFSLHTWDEGPSSLDSGPLEALSYSMKHVTEVQLETPGDVETSNDGCLSPTCMKEVASLLARAYPYKTNHSAWIRHAVPSTENMTHTHNTHTSNNRTNQSTPRGIIYVKNFKAASSTAAGIALRISHRHANPQNGQPAICKWSHVRAFKYSQRDRQQSVLFTSVRDPSSRALSRIFYTSITHRGESPNDANVLQKLRWNHAQYGAVSHHGGGYQVRYCSMIKNLPLSWDPERPNEVIHPLQVQQNVKELILAYDFIMVSERMDESVVAFALLLDLPLSDVLVMNAKQNSNKNGTAQGGDYLYFSWRDTKQKQPKEVCKLSVPSIRSPAVQAHFQSMEWRAKNYGDYLLQEAASQSLDRTIAETFGHDRFHRALQRYQRLKSKANALCANETLSHCSSTGEIQRHLSTQNCYADDSGCGYPCIDRMLLTEPKETEDA